MDVQTSIILKIICWFGMSDLIYTNTHLTQADVRDYGGSAVSKKKEGNSERVQLKSGQKSLGFSSNGGLVSDGQRGPALSWAAAKPDKQVHHSAARLSLPPRSHAARQQTVCLPTGKLITSSLHCCSHRIRTPMCLQQGGEGRAPHRAQLTLQDP